MTSDLEFQGWRVAVQVRRDYGPFSVPGDFGPGSGARPGARAAREESGTGEDSQRFCVG